ncbi:MAG: nitroreductase family protein [Gammaproteobacteria bacterium]|nr:nitroreductase family protein [Gammaproteobacteria bacterium]
MNQIIKDMLDRYTTKKYDKNKRISSENLQIILESMRLCPSSINSQPWRFIVLESDEAKKRMAKTFANKFQFNLPHIFESSHIILFAHNPKYNKDDYAKVIEADIKNKRINLEDKEDAFGAFIFAEMNTDKDGNTNAWTKSQLYLSLGNTLHILARMNIDSTPLEGVDSSLIAKEFVNELNGYQCEVALAIGYHHPSEDYNFKTPKSRLNFNEIFVCL